MSHDIRPSRWQRRLAAAKGHDPARIGKFYNDAPIAAQPTTVAEWEHYLQGLDTPDKFAKAQSDGTFNNALTSYIGAQNKERTDLLAQVRETTEATMTAWLKDNPNVGKDVPINLANGQKQAGAKPSAMFNNPRAIGAPLNGAFPDLYTFLQDISHLNRNPSKESRARLDILNAYSEKVPSEGGFLVPEEFRSEIMMRALEKALVRPRAMVIPMNTSRLSLPTVDETSQVSSVFGGVVVYRTAEGEELVESSASFAALKMDASKQTALSHIPNELMRDVGAFGAFFDATMPQAFSFYEDLDFISGNGSGVPLGALHASNQALITVAAEAGQLANTIVWENCLKMYARLLPDSADNAIWVAGPDTFTELATMALTVGTGGSAIWLTDGTQRPVLTLLGLPVVRSGKAPAALGTQGDLSLVDFSQYAIGDYQQMTIDSSPHAKFTSDKTTLRGIARNDGRPTLLSALTPHNNSATLSAYIQLATRA